MDCGSSWTAPCYLWTLWWSQTLIIVDRYEDDKLKSGRCQVFRARLLLLQWPLSAQYFNTAILWALRARCALVARSLRARCALVPKWAATFRSHHNKRRQRDLGLLNKLNHVFFVHVFACERLHACLRFKLVHVTDFGVTAVCWRSLIIKWSDDTQTLSAVSQNICLVPNKCF